MVVAIMLVIGALTAAGVFAAQRHLSNVANRDLQASINQQMNSAGLTRSVRRAVLSEICDSLGRKSRIQAAIEDQALDLLYPSAHDELRQLVHLSPTADGPDPASDHLRAFFYRFLDREGVVIPPDNYTGAGTLSEPDEQWLNLPGISASNEIGYIVLTSADGAKSIVEVFAVPIISTTRFDTIAALVVGFPFKTEEDLTGPADMRQGIWIDGKLIIDGFSPAERDRISGASKELLNPARNSADPDLVKLGGIPHRVALRPLNSGSAYPLVHEVFVASMADLDVRQQRLRLQILGAAAVLVLAGLIASHFLALRLARPVEALAEASEEEHFQRVRAEEALDQTSRELERAARFSADASHQLKTPVTVMRLGLEELLVDKTLPGHARQEVHDLIRQTGRLSHVIDDLLLLSRLDAGRLKLSLKPENLRVLIDGLLDDLSILPEAGELDIEVDVDDGLLVEGDRSYTSVILQNLLENARKYNRANGRIRIQAKVDDRIVYCRVGNTGSTIPPEMREHIFERFHRGAAGENVSGYGLGLNLAHELARLHGGELSLLRSGNDWTEFELTLRLATTMPDFPTPNT